jgi:hypothetical protein
MFRMCPPMSAHRPPDNDGNAGWYDERFSGYGDIADPISSSSYLLRLLGSGWLFRSRMPIAAT